jgi:hypothetical protein
MLDGIPDRPTILLLGTAHWGNPGLDYHAVEFDDMLAPARQREIEACLTCLLRFSPTKVGLEVTREQAEEVNQDYHAFRRGGFELTANERHQLGFRLAALAHLDEVHGIDWHDFERPIGWDRAVSYALEHEQEHLVTAFTSVIQESGEDRAAERQHLGRMSVEDQLIGTNSPEAMAASHEIYMQLAQVGEEGIYVGADVALRWYERNMMMFVNISRIVASPMDRILIVVGAGHLPLLSHFIRGSGRFRLEHLEEYLA